MKMIQITCKLIFINKILHTIHIKYKKSNDKHKYLILKRFSILYYIIYYNYNFPFISPYICFSLLSIHYSAINHNFFI